MSDKPRSLLRVLTESGPLLALSVALLLLCGIVAPASAQFFGFGDPPPRRPPANVPRGGNQGGGGFGWFGNDVFTPYREAPVRRAAPREDYSKAPAPEKRANDTQPERNVLVLGDAMADWLGYGLEQAYAEQPDVGVVRKVKTVSGLLRYQPKGEPSDWLAAAKEILPNEHPDAIVVMLGLSDRSPIREAALDPKADKKDTKPDAAKPGDKPDAAAKPDAAKPDDKPDVKSTDKPDDKSADDADDDDDDDAAQAAEKGKRAPGGVAQFRTDRWAELYSKKIDELIDVLKSKGVPVLWVGLPVVRGPKATTDVQYLNSLYRDAAAKAGVSYVDVWDGFVDEGGRYVLQGPDFEGQIRRLRSYDGVYFTKYGARKLAHYAEREIARLLAGRSAPVTLPTEPATPEAATKPTGPAPRPLAGQIVPLVAAQLSPDKLLGGAGAKPLSADPLATKTLVKGEPLAAPAGRADDYAWPRRPLETEKAQEPPPLPKETPKPGVPMASATPGERGGAPSAQQQAQQQRRVVRAPPPPSASGFFGFGPPQQQQPQVRRNAPPPSASGFFSIFR